MSDLSITAADVAVIEKREAFTGPAAEAITAGQYVRYNTTSGTIELGNGSGSGESRSGGLATKSVAAGITVTALKKGVMDLGNALSGLAYDADVYLSNTDGTLADAAGSVERIVGTVVPVWGHTTADKALRIDL